MKPPFSFRGDFFDALIRIIQSLFKVDTVSIFFNDVEGHVYKCALGTVSFSPSSFPFFGHSIIKNEILVINDFKNDSVYSGQFLAENDLGICFYAGIPILDSTSKKIGSITIADRKAREFSVSDRQTLVKLGSLVQAEFESEVLLRAIKKLGIRKIDLISAAIGTWEWIIKTDELFLDDWAYDFFGIKKGEFHTSYNDWENNVHPEDKERFQYNMKNLVSTKDNLDIIFRIVSHKSVNVVRLQLVVIRDESGEAIKVIGIHFDLLNKFIKESLKNKEFYEICNYSDGIVDLDLNKKIKTWNRGAEEILGYTPQEVIGKGIKSIIPNKEFNIEIESFKNLKKRGRLDRYKSVFISKNSELIDVVKSLSTIINKSGEIVGFSSIFHVISKEILFERVLLLHELIIKNITEKGEYIDKVKGLLKIICKYFSFSFSSLYRIDSASGGLVLAGYWQSKEIKNNIFKKSTQKISFNKKNIFPASVCKSKENIFIRDINLEESFSRKESANAVGIKNGFAIPVIYKDEVVGVLELFSTDHNEKYLDSLYIINIIVAEIGQFIVNQRYIQELEIFKKRLVLATKAGRIGVWDWDVVNNILIWDDQMYEIYGLDKDDTPKSYETWRNCVLKEDLLATEKKLKEALYSEKDFDCEFRITLSDNSIRYVLAKSIVLKDENQNPIQMIGFNKDITHEKEEEQRKIEKIQNTKSEEFLNVKSNFISMVSHELRTPLAIIKESLSILKDDRLGSINAEQDRFLKIAKTNVDRLSRLINDVLDYQKLESKCLVFNMKEYSINNVVNEVYSNFSSCLESDDLKINLVLGDKIPLATFDKDKIVQVLFNLLNNAIVYSGNKGVITLITEMVGGNLIKVSVKDEGVGIKVEDLDKLFKSFSQIKTGINRKSGGTGLGLVLCQKLIEEHHGTVDVVSEYGKGSTFYFTLPLKQDVGK